MVVAKQTSDVVGRDHQGVSSLVDVLCTLAGNWVRCECGKKLKESGLGGWRKKAEELEERINELSIQLPVVEMRSKREGMQNELKQLKAQSDALNQEWRKAYDEARVFEKLFQEAREFCKDICNISDDELFNAALVRFRSKRLRPEQVPSDSRMAKIKSLLKNVPFASWQGKIWANPPKPTLVAARGASPNMLHAFITQVLRTETYTPAAQSEWLTISRVAIGLNENKGTISRLITRGILRDNGLTGSQRRIDPTSVLQYCKEKKIPFDPT